MVHYALGYCHSRKGDTVKALEYYKKAEQDDHSYCFPNRIEEVLVLQDAMKENHEACAKAAYALGNFWYAARQYVPYRMAQPLVGLLQQTQRSAEGGGNTGEGLPPRRKRRPHPDGIGPALQTARTSASGTSRIPRSPSGRNGKPRRPVHRAHHALPPIRTL